MTDPNTQSEHTGTNIWTAICLLLVIAGQTCWPFFAGWNYFSNGIYDLLVVVSAGVTVYSIVKARKAVWSNDLSPNGLFALGFIFACITFLLPVIWHVGVQDHNLQ
jgi:hypothetical protein